MIGVRAGSRGALPTQDLVEGRLGLGQPVAPQPLRLDPEAVDHRRQQLAPGDRLLLVVQAVGPALVDPIVQRIRGLSKLAPQDVAVLEDRVSPKGTVGGEDAARAKP